MFTRTLVATVAIAASLGARADCPVLACYAIDIRATECEFRMSDRERQIGPVYLKGEVSGVDEVRCMVEAGPAGQSFAPRLDITSGSVFAYRAYNSSACQAFLGKAVRVFVPDQCCDTIPHNGDCKIGRTILIGPLPPQAQGE